MLGCLVIFSCLAVKPELNPPLGIGSDRFWSSANLPTALLSLNLSEQTGVRWTSGHHSGSPVIVGACGQQSLLKNIKGILENHTLFKSLANAIDRKLNVILVIGDGFGLSHLTLPIYDNIARAANKKTAFENIIEEGTMALLLTHTDNEIITESAAAATALACGQKTLNGFLGLNADGFPATSLLEIAKKNKMRTGLITDTRLTHATPAAFYVHRSDRDNEAEIAALLAEQEIEVLLGGGAKFFLPAKAPQINDSMPLPRDWYLHSARKDSLNLIDRFQREGYTIFCHKDQLPQIPPFSKKILGLFSPDAMSAAIDRDDEETGEPALPVLTDLALKVLNQTHSGFFLVVECGRIDWESHRNDVGAVYKAVLEMDQVLHKCFEFYQNNLQNTLLVFTADHETGGLQMNYRSGKSGSPLQLPSGILWKTDKDYLSFPDFLLLSQQKMSLEKILSLSTSSEQLEENVKQYTGYEISPVTAKTIMKIKKHKI